MSKQLQVLMTDRPWPDDTVEREILDAAGIELQLAADSEEATLTRLAADVDAIATCWAQVPRGVIEACPNCKLVSRMGIGLDNIDVAAATERGIPVTNVPDYCVEEVADHAMGLLLSVARRIAFFHHRTKQGEYDLSAAGPMHRLSGRTLGLIGLGHTGTAMYRRALGFGLQVVAHTRSGNTHGTDCEMVDFDELLKRSDYISIHAPLTEQTHHLFNADAFESIKPGAIIVNTSRGGLIDPAALNAAIQDGRVAGAGLDVFEPEPPDLSEPLYQDERVIVTPHAAFVSEESILDLRRRVAEQIVAVLSGRRPENVVNPAVYEE